MATLANGSGLWLHVHLPSIFITLRVLLLAIHANVLKKPKLIARSTPLGQAIGISTHTLYSPNSEIGLLVVGIMNAISAGFLIYASLIELMSEDFLSDPSWQILRGKKRVIACLLVFFGAFLMSLVGAWA